MSITGSNNPFACEPVVFANANSIVSLGTITRDGNQFTFSVGFVWKINGVTYQNTTPVVITIAEASTGFQRIDNALLNTSNTIELQQGLESDTIALRPTFPDNNILLTSWNISGDAIGDTETPIVGAQFKQKTENQSYNYSTTGSNVILPLRGEGQNHYIVDNEDLVSVDGFDKTVLILVRNSEAPPYEGKDYLFENKSPNSVELNHLTSAEIPFSLPNEENLIVPAGGAVWFKYKSDVLVFIMKSWNDPVISKFKGKFTSKANLDAVFPTATDGDYAIVDAGTGSDAIEYIWDNEEGWVLGNSVGASTTDALVEGSTNLYFQTTRVLATALSGLSLLTGGAIVFTDTVLQAFGKLQKQINDLTSGKLDKVTTSGVERVYTINTDGSQGTKATSNFKDVIEGYFNGINFYTDSGFTNLITPESGKIYLNISVTPAAQYRWSGSVYVQMSSSETFDQSTWMFSDFYSENSYQPPFNGSALSSGSKDVAVYSSSTKDSLGAFLLFSGTSANGGYRILDTSNPSFGGFRSASNLTFYGIFSLISQSDSRDRVIRIGFHNAINQNAPIHGCFLEILGSTAYFKTRKSSVETSSIGVALTSVLYHKVLIEFISTTSVNCKLVDSSGNVVLNVNHTTNIPTTGNRFGCGLVATITTAGTNGQIMLIDYMGVGRQKPNFLNNF